MNTFIRSAFLLGVICFFQGCGEEPLTEEQLENEVAVFLESRGYPDREELDITMQLREEQDVWHVEVAPKAEHRGELSGDWNWPVQILINRTGTIISVY